MLTFASPVIDQDGYNYEVDFEGVMVLDKSFQDGEILPGMKKRGEFHFLFQVMQLI